MFDDLIRAADPRMSLPSDQLARQGRLRELAPIDSGPPHLEITTTDVEGVQRAYVDRWGEMLVALEHRARFSFRKALDFSASKLANAARSSASYPFAFDPWKVEDAGARGLAGMSEPRVVIDGGLLDNAPIRAVLDLIPERAAQRQVQRFVCYMNADPVLPELQTGTPDDENGAQPTLW